MSQQENNTRCAILHSAKAEFMKYGFRQASLRTIAKNAGVTTGALYGCFSGKESLFEALVIEQYSHFLDCYRNAQKSFAELAPEEQPKHMSDISGQCMEEMLIYAYEHLEEFKLILLHSEGTRFSYMVDEMIEIESKATHDYQSVLEKLGMDVMHIDEHLEHILITGMFNAYFELIIHEMPIGRALEYLREMRTFYTAGWMKIMGQ